jgi:hypothetical protein
MTIRQRQAPGGAPVANGVDAGHDRTAPFSWEDWFRHATAQQRADALGLARQQGLVYPHQLPAISNGVKPAAAGKDTPTSQLVARLLAGKSDGLPHLAMESPSFFDTELDDLQRQAVVAALATPDLLMLQGLPGTGKSRVLTEFVRQAATRGWRILFLAGHPASLDVILQRLGDCPEALPLRFLDAQEKPELLPAWLRAFTLEEQKKAFLERMSAGARSNHDQAESVCRQRREQEPLWNELRACAGRQRDVQERLQALNAQLPGLAADVERAAGAPDAGGAWRMRLAELRRAADEEHQQTDAALRTQQEALARAQQENAGLAARIAEREPAFLAKKQGRWWTPAYWLNLFNSQIVPDMEALQDQHAKASAVQKDIASQIEQLTEHQTQRREQFQQERAVLLAAEVEVRRQALQAQLEAAEEAARNEDAIWTALCRQLDIEPADKTPPAITAAHEDWQQRKTRDEQQCQFAQQWTRFVQDAGPGLAAKLPSYANVLAGTVMRWHTDAKFRDAVGEPVDLLIVEDAETLTEADLLKLSRQAQRSVLVGQALAEPTPPPSVAEKASRVLLPAPLVSAACWHKLWQTLGGDAGCWPCAWHREEGRLVCQLRPLGDEDRKHLESEGLADAPDIELRILHRPSTRPCLAQVIFGPHRSFADAFQFMVAEVQEFPLEPLSRTGWWSEDGHRHCRHLGPGATRVHAWLDLEAGLRLGTVADDHGDATRIGCIEFDKSAGWDRAKADAWLQQHRPVCDHGRTFFLQTPYRYRPALAHAVRTMVRTDDWLPVGAQDGERSLEFTAVPALAKHDWPREGAGLELDLSAPRHADRLPVGLRQSLPPRGFVNYLEAQALIRRLEAWQLKESTPNCRIALLALYEGQVELLRRLVEQSEILRARTYPLEVALPSRLHQRECDVVFLSLTRSHAHRCTAFGEDVKELPLALTRPRSRLFLFGDPGALVKRIGWHGPLDHLDAASAHQELVRLSRLLAYLQKHVHASPVKNGLPNGRD